MSAEARIAPLAATAGESSSATVALALGAALATPHAIDVHRSTAQSPTIACGEVGGVRTPAGALVVGLREMGRSGFSGIAVLAPNAAAATETDVSVFLAQGLTPAGAAPATTGGTTVPAVPPTAGATTAAGGTVAVTLKEFTITMPTALAAGPTTFRVANAGTIVHSFVVEGQGREQRLPLDLQPGQTATLTVALKPGRYEAYCPIDGHKARGMDVDLTVR